MDNKIKFLPSKDEREKAVHPKGVEISKWSDWDINVITDTFLEALEDSNAHTLRGRIDATIEDYWKTVQEQNEARDKELS